MVAELYLIAPPEPDPKAFPALLKAVLEATHIAALLLTVGDDEAVANELSAIAQAEGCAVILKDRPDLVRKLGADGVHITGGQKAFTEAVKALQPDFMVGAGDLRSKHETMLRGEAGADYLMFGPLTGLPTREDRELAEWWAETFEPPSVFAQPGVALDSIDETGSEFIAIGETLWAAPDPVAAIRALRETESA